MSEEAAKDAAYALTNLNLFVSLQTLLEGGHLYPSYNETAEKIIKLCKAETQRQIRAYDRAIRRYKP